MGMKIEIDLAELGLTGYDEDGNPVGPGNTLQDLIIEAAVERIIPKDRDLRYELKDKVDKTFTKRVNERVEELVEEAFDAPIQRMTSWGDKQGDPTTVRELIRESLESWLRAPGSGDRYSNGSKNLQDLITNSTKSLLDKDFTEYLKQIKENVRVTVHKAALEQAVKFLGGEMK